MDIENILSSVDIVELASKYTDLEQRGDEWWGISPITQPRENTPSFSCRRETGKFYDFSSGVGGSAITLIQYCEGVSKRQAIETLCQFAGVDGVELKPQHKLSATTVCRAFSPPKQHAKKLSGVVLPDDYMERYEIRDDKLEVWRQEGISDESLRKFDVRYDGFANRLVYPIKNIEGQIVNVGGRTLDPDWKEKKLRKYNYYHSWGSINVVYGLYDNLEHIMKEREIILFEGCKSVLIADTWGIKNCGAILTSHLSPLQMKILASIGCRVVFALDKEVDVRKDHNIQKLKQYANVYYLYDKDDRLELKDAPVDKGKEVFEYLYNNKLRLNT